MGARSWPAETLAELAVAVSAAETEAAAARAAVAHAAEALDAQIAAIVSGGRVVAAVGHPGASLPRAELAGLRPGVAGWLEVPGAGRCAAVAAALEHPPGASLVLARSGPEGLSRQETGLLHAMARVTALAFRMLALRESERAARAEVGQLATEQEALRRVAKLMARAASPEEIYAAVAEQVARLAQADIATVLRCEPGGLATVLGGWGDAGRHLAVGSRLTVEGEGVAVSVLRTGQPARTSRFAGPPGSVADALRQAGMQTGGGTPILVEGRLWGAVIAARASPEPLPPATAYRIPFFTELVATAIADAQARAERRRYAEEQAALRRVATLVARAAPSAAVFATVAEEVGNVLPAADVAYVGRYDSGQELEFVGGWSRVGEADWAGHRVSLGGQNIATLVFENNEPARVEHLADDDTTATAVARRSGARSGAGAPIRVEGRLWGVMTVGSARAGGLPPGIEHQLAGFTELVATAIANAEAHAELTASRARIVATADETRRRIERDLHDGAQQRLVSLALQLRAAQARVPAESGQLAAELSAVAAGLNSALQELREYARGIHPPILARSGLAAALRALGRRSPVPVELDVPAGLQLPERVEVTAYYTVCEALANAAKHAKASAIRVRVEADHEGLRLSVSDNGVGGANLAHGSGLVGLKDRVEAAGGRLTVQSHPGQGTQLVAELPIAGRPPAAC
jgi:signal transduction histidine kinase